MARHFTTVELKIPLIQWIIRVLRWRPHGATQFCHQLIFTACKAVITLLYRNHVGCDFIIDKTILRMDANHLCTWARKAYKRSYMYEYFVNNPWWSMLVYQNKKVETRNIHNFQRVFLLIIETKWSVSYLVMKEEWKEKKIFICLFDKFQLRLKRSLHTFPWWPLSPIAYTHFFEFSLLWIMYLFFATRFALAWVTIFTVGRQGADNTGNLQYPFQRWECICRANSRVYPTYRSMCQVRF